MNQNVYCDLMGDSAEMFEQEIACAINSSCFAFDSDDESELLKELEALENEDLPASSLLPTVRDERGETDQSKHEKISQKSDILPSNDQDIVRYLINKQKFDGLWDLDSEIIKLLTGKSLSVFQLMNFDISTEILSSSIVILILETRFSAFSSLWYGVVQKGRDRISDLLGKDSNKINQLFNDLRSEL